MPTVGIDDLLNRRSDLSTFLVHFTKDAPGGPDAAANLRSILENGVIEARTAMGWTGRGATLLPESALAAMKVVCFSETPLEHAYSLYADIRGRSTNLKGYGLAFSKRGAQGMGANPVWYINQYDGHGKVIGRALNKLRDDARDLPTFRAHPAAKILPFCEAVTSSSTTRKEFTWEREWRHLGGLYFSDDDLAFILAPEAERADFEALSRRPVIDPSWGLERIIERLADLASGPSVTSDEIMDL